MSLHEDIERRLQRLAAGTGDAWDAWFEFISRPEPPLGSELASALLNTAPDDRERIGHLVAGLTWHSAPDARARLEDLLLSAGQDLNREDLVEAIERIGDPRSVPILVRALDCPDPGEGLRPKIALALGRIGGPEAERTLGALANDTRVDVSRWARIALAEVKGEPPPAEDDDEEEEGE